MSVLAFTSPSRPCKATEEDCNPEIPGKKTWRNKCGRWVSGTAVLEEDDGGSKRKSWMETSGLWSMLHWE